MHWILFKFRFICNVFKAFKNVSSSFIRISLVIDFLHCCHNSHQIFCCCCSHSSLEKWSSSSDYACRFISVSGEKNDHLCYCTQLPTLVVRVHVHRCGWWGDLCVCVCVYIYVLSSRVMHAPTSTLPLFFNSSISTVTSVNVPSRDIAVSGQETKIQNYLQKLSPSHLCCGTLPVKGDRRR